MGKTIYVVTEGCYSDYRILEVFENKDKAAAYISHKDMRIEEYELHDDAINEGKIKAVYLYQHEIYPLLFKKHIRCELIFKQNYRPSKYFFECLLPERDDEKAFKILCDKLTEYKAKHAGIV